MNFVVGLIVAIGLLVASVLFLIATDPGLLETEHADMAYTASHNPEAASCDCHLYHDVSYVLLPSLT